jgi:hypothetical protein
VFTKASDIPFDSGLFAGVVIGTRWSPLGGDHRLDRGVAAAVIAEPLAAGRLSARGPKAGRDGLVHEWLDIGHEQIPRRGHRRERLPIVTVEDEAELHQLAIPAGDLQYITAPAFVRHVSLNQASVCPPRPPPRRVQQRPAVGSFELPGCRTWSEALGTTGRARGWDTGTIFSCDSSQVSAERIGLLDRRRRISGVLEPGLGKVAGSKGADKLVAIRPCSMRACDPGLQSANPPTGVEVGRGVVVGGGRQQVARTRPLSRISTACARH